jgi:hypothetical protein
MMKFDKLSKTKSLFMVIAGVLLNLAAMAVRPALRVRAYPTSPIHFQKFEAVGYQASSSAPLVFRGTPIGENAVWQLQAGPLESDSFATIPSGGSFPGALCKAD